MRLKVDDGIEIPVTYPRTLVNRPYEQYFRLQNLYKKKAEL